MLRDEKTPPRIEKLSKIKSSLTKERKEYEKYHDYLNISIDSLFESNTKLLSSLKEKYATCIILLKRYNSIDISLNDQIKAIANGKKIKKVIDQVSNSKKDNSKQNMSPKEAMNIAIHLVKHEVKDLYSRLQLFRRQNLYEEKYLEEIKELKKKKEKLEDKKRLLEQEISFYKKQFFEISQYNGCDGFLFILSNLEHNISNCQRLRQDKLDILNFYQQMRRTQSFHQKVKGIDPSSILVAFDIELNSDTSTNNISSLCQSTDNNSDNCKNQNNDNKNQVGFLSSSTEFKVSNNHEYDYSKSNVLTSSKVKNKKEYKTNKSDKSSKHSYPSSTDTQRFQSLKFDEKKKKIIKEISTNGNLNNMSKQKDNKSYSENQKKTKNTLTKNESITIRSSNTDTYDDYYDETFYSTTSYNQEKSTKKSDSDKKSKKKSSSSTQNEKSEVSKQEEVLFQKNGKADSQNEIKKSKNINRNESEVDGDESELGIIQSEVCINNGILNDDKIHNSDKFNFPHKISRLSHRNLNKIMFSDIPDIKNNEEIQNADSHLKMSSIKSCGSLTSLLHNADRAKRMHNLHKQVPVRVPVIPPEKCDLFMTLLQKFHKENEKNNRNKDTGNIQIAQSNRSSKSYFNISSSQLFYNEFNDSNEFLAFLKKSNELKINEFDTFTQTDGSFRKTVVAILNEQLERFKNEDKINDSIYKNQNQLDELEISISNVNREIAIRKKKKEQWMKSFQIIPPDKLNKIELNIKKITEKVNSTSQTEKIRSINKIRDEIIKNSKLNPKSFLKKMERRDLVAMLQKKKLELKIIKMTNVRKQLDIDSLLKRLKVVDPLMYSAETHEPAQIEIDRNILDKKQQKLDKIASIDRHFNDAVAEGEMLSSQVADQQYLVETITNYLTDMAKEPKSNVQLLCRSLKQDRSSINEVNRQVRFVTIENDAISKEISRYDEIISHRSLTGMNQKVDNLYKYLMTLKSRFNSLRALKEKRSYVMTCEEEMNSLQRQINIVISEIDVYRMRINGTISKIEKQIRSINSLNIRNPKPISNLTWNDKSKSPYKL